MFESGAARTADLNGLLATLTRIDSAADDTERVDQLDVLERLKSVAAAAQARITVDLVESQQRIATAARERARDAAAAGDFDTWKAEARRRAGRIRRRFPSEA
jgi:surface antigen